MVRPGFVIFVPYANQRCLIGATDVFLDSVANSAVFPRNWASFTPAPRKGELQLRVAVFWASFYAHAAIFKNCFFLVLHHVRVTIESRHILRLIINTVNYPIQSRLMFLND